MVNPTASSDTLSPSPTVINQHTSLATLSTDEGCNDDPPPIPLPPAGNGVLSDSNKLLAGGDSSNSALYNTISCPQHNMTAGPENIPSSRQTSGNPSYPDIRVYDYGSSPVDEWPFSNGVDTADSTAGLQPTRTRLLFGPSSASSSTDSVSSVHSQPGPLSSTQSSLTAVELPSPEGDVDDTSADVYYGENPHTVDANAIAAALRVQLNAGLNTLDATERHQKDGANSLSSDGGIMWYTILGRQVSNSLTVVLAIAMAASFGMHDFIEGSVIAAVIALNIVIGFVQDYRAEMTMQSLHSLSAPEATVVRNQGKIEKIKAEELVVGDIVKIRVGDVVPADIRVSDSMNLETNEALLTGESLPIVKNAEFIAENADCPIGDRNNMAWASSTVTKGRGSGIVVAIGMHTQVGMIAELLRGKKQREGGPFRRFISRIADSVKHVLGLVGTPLQVKLSKFALVLFGLAILLAVIVFSVSKWKINDDNLIYGICVAVAVIPESLIAVLTVTMAVGTKTMAKGNVIVRKMQALEAIGGVTNICSDKTGTLTQGKMVARKAVIPVLGEISVEGVESPFDPTSGSVTYEKGLVDASLVKKSPELEIFLEGIALCNLSTVTRNDASYGSSEKLEGQWAATGEPTEISLQVFAMRFCRGKQDLLASGDWELLAEHPFDSTVKKMAVVYFNSRRDTIEAYMKGAGEVIVPTLAISEEKKSEIMETIESLAGQGLRVLCVAHKRIQRSDANERVRIEEKMNFLGLVGLYDPPRLETSDAVRRCKIAGVQVHMLTGDHIRTATSIAHEVGILGHAMPSALASSMVMTAGEFDALSDADVDGLPVLPRVIARCSPATKVRMVEALHRRGAFCVMTGDGVNDSPALKRADVGIAMGLSGSDVAKDASDLVLTDDNFASIVRAVEEGRRLFDNIQKFIMHLLISNIAQVVLLLIGLAFRDKNGVSVFPLSPLEILWVNMITSSFLALGLGLEEKSPDVMTRPPHNLRAGIFTWEVIIDKTLYGVTMGVLCLTSYLIVIYAGNGGNLGLNCNHGYNSTCTAVFKARASVFAVLSFLLLLTAWEVKHFTRSLFRLDPERHSGPFAVFHAVLYNRFLFWAVAAGFVITFPVIYIPVFNTVVFKHMGITWEWGIVGGACVAYLCVVEGWKGIKRWRKWGSAARPTHRVVNADFYMDGGIQEEV